MRRFMGMMPTDEIKMEKAFKDQYGYTIHIQAGPHGWTVIWADGASNYQDVDASTEENFAAAKELVESKGFTLTEINQKPMGEC